MGATYPTYPRSMQCVSNLTTTKIPRPKTKTDPGRINLETKLRNIKHTQRTRAQRKAQLQNAIAACKYEMQTRCARGNTRTQISNATCEREVCKCNVQTRKCKRDYGRETRKRCENAKSKCDVRLHSANTACGCGVRLQSGHYQLDSTKTTTTRRQPHIATRCEPKTE